MMKIRYYCFIGIAVIIYFILFFVLKTHLELSSWITVSATLGGTFAAIITAVIALGIADKPPKFVAFTVDVEVDRDNIHTYETDSISLPVFEELIKQRIMYPNSYRIYFNITNVSGFTLQRPVITFELPTELKHPKKWTKDVQKINLTYHSNLFNVRSDVRRFEFEDRIVLSNNILPYLNKNQELKIWIRMCLSKDDALKYSIKVSLNCDNAEGKTMTETITPSELLEGLDESTKEGTG